MKRVRRKEVRVRGFVRRKDNGRAEYVYGRKCKEGDEEHETMVYEFELITRFRVERDARIGKTEADGVLEHDGDLFFLEVDNSGKMSAKQMRKKWERYRGVTNVLLVVCTKEHRMHKLIKDADPVKNVAIFTTFDRLRNVAEPWLDCLGNTLALPSRLS